MGEGFRFSFDILFAFIGDGGHPCRFFSFHIFLPVLACLLFTEKHLPRFFERVQSFLHRIRGSLFFICDILNILFHIADFSDSLQDVVHALHLMDQLVELIREAICALLRKPVPLLPEQIKHVIP